MFSYRVTGESLSTVKSGCVEHNRLICLSQATGNASSFDSISFVKDSSSRAANPRVSLLEAESFPFPDNTPHFITSASCCLTAMNVIKGDFFLPSGSEEKFDMFISFASMAYHKKRRAQEEK